jgi:hypothetical protein
LDLELRHTTTNEIEKAHASRVRAPKVTTKKKGEKAARVALVWRKIPINPRSDAGSKH